MAPLRAIAAVAGVIDVAHDTDPVGAVAGWRHQPTTSVRSVAGSRRSPLTPRVVRAAEAPARERLRSRSKEVGDVVRPPRPGCLADACAAASRPRCERRLAGTVDQDVDRVPGVDDLGRGRGRG